MIKPIPFRPCPLLCFPPAVQSPAGMPPIPMPDRQAPPRFDFSRYGGQIARRLGSSAGKPPGLPVPVKKREAKAIRKARQSAEIEQGRSSRPRADAPLASQVFGIALRDTEHGKWWEVSLTEDGKRRKNKFPFNDHDRDARYREALVYRMQSLQHGASLRFRRAHDGDHASRPCPENVFYQLNPNGGYWRARRGDTKKGYDYFSVGQFGGECAHRLACRSIRLSETLEAEINAFAPAARQEFIARLFGGALRGDSLPPALTSDFMLGNRPLRDFKLLRLCLLALGLEQVKTAFQETIEAGKRPDRHALPAGMTASGNAV